MEIIHHKKSIEKNMTDQPKYLNKNRTWFKCVKTIWKLSILALWYFGDSSNLGKVDPNTVNGMGYTGRINKSSTPCLVPNEIISMR